MKTDVYEARLKTCKYCTLHIPLSPKMWSLNGEKIAEQLVAFQDGFCSTRPPSVEILYMLYLSDTMCDATSVAVTCNLSSCIYHLSPYHFPRAKPK